jgi:hypothetical protein
MDYLISNGVNPFRDKIAAPFEKRLAMTDAYSTLEIYIVQTSMLIENLKNINLKIQQYQPINDLPR